MFYSRSNKLILLAITAVVCSPELEKFKGELNKAKPHLSWIEQTANYNDVQYDDSVYRQERTTVDDILSTFQQFDSAFADDLEGGDAWYRDFRAKECSHGYCVERSFEGAHHKTKSHSHKRIEPEYEEYDDGEAAFEESVNVDDQIDDRKNDLSHEANYKLSKIEQDISEKRVRANNSKIVKEHFRTKRSLDPLTEVELKTSNKLMLKGLGASLPSNVLNGKEQIPIGDMSTDLRSSMNNADYETNDIDENSKTGYRRKSCNNRNFDLYDTARVLGADRFDNLKQTNPKFSPLEGMQFDNIHPFDMSAKVKPEILEKKLDKDLTLSLKDEVVGNPSFMTLESILKGSSAVSNKNHTTNASKKTTVQPSTKATIKPVQNVNDKENKNINIKLKMSINATIPKNSNLPLKNFHKNNTIKFAKKLDASDTLDLLADRYTRGIIFPSLSSSIKRKTNDGISQSVREITNEFPYDELITGKLTSQLIKTVFTLVKTTPDLNVLWPALEINKPPTCKQVKNFYAIRNFENESEMHRTELMLQKTMETINAIIEQQVRSRTCIPLRPDLHDFYEQILSTRAANERNRGKRTVGPNDFSKELRQIDANKINTRSKVVKKLLHQYEDLSQEDQEEMQPIKETLLMDLVNLRKLKTEQIGLYERKKREIAKQFQNSTFVASAQNDPDELTAEYLKLLKTAQLLKQGGDDMQII